MTGTPKSRGILPDFCFDRVVHLTTEWLANQGFLGLLIDIDNTITRWEDPGVLEEEAGWLAQVQEAGLRCRLLSNGLWRKKAAVVRQTGIAHVSGLPVKPLRGAFTQGLDDLGLRAGQVLMIGDSVITDIVSANQLGLWTCLVEPLSKVDFFGSKIYRVAERLLGLRRPLKPHNDFRSGRPGSASRPTPPAGSGPA